MTPFDRRIRLAVYETFRDTGLRPSPQKLATGLGALLGEVEAGLERLADAHLLALEAGSHRIWMAHPFSGIETSFTVTIGSVRYHGNCAWDVVAIAVILGEKTEIRLQCDATGSTEKIRIGPVGVEGAGVIHHVVPARAFWDNVGYT